MADPQQEVEIVLIEDSPEDAELTIRVLKEQNLANRLVWLKNGALGLDFLFGRGAYAGRNVVGTPRLVLLDLSLPKIGGLEVLQQLKADPRTRKIPVVVLSSSTQDKDILRTYDLGVNSYVSKPVHFEAFAQVVTQMGLYWMLINKPPIES
jgi:two-component system response regulator